jgi:hypothetical protein
MKLWIAFRLPIVDRFQIGPRCQCRQRLWPPFKFQPFLDCFQDSNWPSLTMWTTPLAAFQVSAFSSWRLLHGDFRISCRTCTSGGMDSQWIVSRRHQVRKHVLFLVTSSLHVSRSPYPIYATVAAPRFFVLWHKECAVIHSFSHQPLPPWPVS